MGNKFMKTFILVFRRRRLENYVGFHNDLTSYPSIKYWCHYFTSSYLIRTDLSARELSELVVSLIEKYSLAKRHLILEVNLHNCAGLLPKEAWEWIHKHSANNT